MRSICCLISLTALAPAPVMAQAPATWTLVEELRIGGGEGPTDFVDVRAIATTARGEMVVLEAQAHELRFFDARGRHLRTVGRKGRGPGEFERPNGVLRAPDGTLWVNDVTRRLTVFSDTGALLRTLSSRAQSWGWLWDARFDGTGRLIRSDLRPVAGGGWQSVLIRERPGESTSDSFPAPTCGPVVRPTVWEFPRGRKGVPWTSGRRVALDPRGAAWCVHTGTYDLTWTPLGAAKPAFEARGEASEVRVTAAERDSVIADAREFMKVAGEAALDFSLIPARKPAVEQVAVDDRGRLWVRHAGNGPGSRWDVRDGARLVATVTAPFRASTLVPPLVVGDRLYAVVTDDDGFPFVVAARIVTR